MTYTNLKTRNYFNVMIEKEFEKQIKSENIDFFLEINENGEITEDGGSFNPTSGWTNYTHWNQGWSEQDEDLNELIEKLEEFTLTEAMWIEGHIADMNIDNEGEKYRTTYEGEYNITLTVNDLIFINEDGEEITPIKKQIWSENSQIKVGDEISHTNSDFQYDEGYNTFSNEEKPYWYNLLVVPTRTEHDDENARNQGGSSGNYSYNYFQVLKILGQGENIELDGETTYVNIIKTWENLMELPEEIEEYILDVSEYDGEKKYLQNDNIDDINNKIMDYPIMDIVFCSLWRYSHRYGRDKWMRYNPEGEFSGYLYPDEIEKYSNILAVRVWNDVNDEILYVAESSIGVDEE